VGKYFWLSNNLILQKPKRRNGLNQSFPNAIAAGRD